MKRKRVTFELSAADAKKPFLVGDFNGWNSEAHPMKRERAGKWKLRILLPPGTYQYAVLVDGKTIEDSTELNVKPHRFQASSDRLNVYFPWTQEI